MGTVRDFKLWGWDAHRYACVLQVDELVERQQARPPLKSELYLSKSRKRLRNLSEVDCEDRQTFLYQGREVWNGF